MVKFERRRSLRRSLRRFLRTSLSQTNKRLSENLLARLRDIRTPGDSGEDTECLPSKTQYPSQSDIVSQGPGIDISLRSHSDLGGNCESLRESIAPGQVKGEAPEQQIEVKDASGYLPGLKSHDAQRSSCCSSGKQSSASIQQDHEFVTPQLLQAIDDNTGNNPGSLLQSDNFVSTVPKNHAAQSVGNTIDTKVRGEGGSQSKEGVLRAGKIQIPDGLPLAVHNLTELPPEPDTTDKGDPTTPTVDNSPAACRGSPGLAVYGASYSATERCLLPTHKDASECTNQTEQDQSRKITATEPLLGNREVEPPIISDTWKEHAGSQESIPQECEIFKELHISSNLHVCQDHGQSKSPPTESDSSIKGKPAAVSLAGDRSIRRRRRAPPARLNISDPGKSIDSAPRTGAEVAWMLGQGGSAPPLPTRFFTQNGTLAQTTSQLTVRPGSVESPSQQGARFSKSSYYTARSSRSSWFSGGTFQSARSSFTNQLSCEVHIKSATSSSGFDYQSTHVSASTIRTREDKAVAGNMKMGSIEARSHTAWHKYLLSMNLIPDRFEEKDWSGRGQHAEYGLSEAAIVPLVLERNLGKGVTAIVESVRCKRIRLARKTISRDHRIRREEAIKEVEHLQRLSHAHIVRVVGTYVMGKNLSILLYPVAEYNLGTFMESICDRDMCPTLQELLVRLQSLYTFFECLAHALQYIHSNATKHLDIKPKNLLVRDMRLSRTGHRHPFKVYIADFGIARSYPFPTDAETETPVPFTRIYAAPEVVLQERRGFSADIFSLGCVYTEMLAVIAGEGCRNRVDVQQRLIDIRNTNKHRDNSYQANIPAVQQFLLDLQLDDCDRTAQKFRAHAIKMLNKNPRRRPSTQEIAANSWGIPECCVSGAEDFEAAADIAVEGTMPIRVENWL